MVDAGSTPKRAWVFGAGIAGLTAAHELAERGFEVTVIEQEEDPRNFGAPALGGMARTQWAIADHVAYDKFLSLAPAAKGSDGAPQRGEKESRTKHGPGREMSQAQRLLGKRRFYFNDNTSDPVDGESIKVYAKELYALYVASGFIPLPRMRFRGYQRKSETDMALSEQRAIRLRCAVRAAILEAAAKDCPDDAANCIGDWPTEDAKAGDWPDPADKSNRSCADVEIVEVPIPAEHGFRYFPAFYRHVFDTMGRIRLNDDRRSPLAVPFRTVLDNVVPTKVVTVALVRDPVSSPEGAKSDGSSNSGGQAPYVDKEAQHPPNHPKPPRPPPIAFPRDAPRSLRAIQDMLANVFERLGHTERDVAHLSLKLAKYLTSGKRRRKEYEEQLFSDFLEVDRLSKKCRGDVEAAPEILAGMRATESDARTQGSAAMQVLLNQLTGSPYSDATLNGPTTSVWFAAWREYLEFHGVRFLRGTLESFETFTDDKGRPIPNRVKPKVNVFSPRDAEPELHSADWFVLAVSLPALLPCSEAKLGGDLCRSFLSALENASGDGEEGDFKALQEWIDEVAKQKPQSDRGWEWNVQKPQGPFRHVTGIQYYFETNQEPTFGHTVYADSEWRLSSISQVTFWNQSRSPASGYRGVVSVDIGEWGETRQRVSMGGGPKEGATKEVAWFKSPNDVAKEVWGQISRSLARGVASPSFYHLDDGMEYTPPDKKDHGVKGTYTNRTPYLVTRPCDWKYRPGTVSYDGLPAGSSSLYQVAAGRWVLCGTFMKTFTRITTMESANESARHAVNALLDAFEKDTGNEQKHVPRCEIFPMEDHELDDVQWLRDVDDRLHEANLPHLLDLGEAHKWIDALLPRRAELYPKEGGT